MVKMVGKIIEFPSTDSFELENLKIEMDEMGGKPVIRLSDGADNVLIPAEDWADFSAAVLEVINAK